MKLISRCSSNVYKWLVVVIALILLVLKRVNMFFSDLIEFNLTLVTVNKPLNIFPAAETTESEKRQENITLCMTNDCEDVGIKTPVDVS